ncbi:MAG: heparin lyase I family protein, partial [Arenicellales bacterium]
SDGWFTVWVNGEEKTSYYGKTMSCKEVYFKYGVYRSFVSLSPKSKTVTTIAYYDGVVRSKSKEGMFDSLPE